MLGGRYRLERELGSGGMAVVWAATDAVLGRSVAVKMLAGRHATSLASLQRIRVEARTAATLSHPNIAQVHDYGEVEEDGLTVPYVVMELVTGPTLQQRIAEGPVEPQVAFRICAEVAAALTAAHAASLVHRDIKPANVIVTAAGAKVVDFGIAASAGPGGEGDPPDVVLGTPSYLAPERLTDDAVEPASDVYALGVILYKLIAGHLPWQTDTTTQLLTAHVYTEPTPLPDLPGVPAEVVELCERCLRKDPARRPDAQEIAAVLAAAASLQVVTDERAHAAAGPVRGGEPSVVLIPPDGPAPARPRLFAAGAVAAGLAVVAAVLVGAAMAAEPDQDPGSVDPRTAVLSGGATTAVAGSATPGSTTATVPRSGSARPGASGTPSAAGTGTGAAEPGTTAVPPPSPTADPTPPPPQVRTLSSPGGSVRATCTTDGRAQLLSWAAATSYRVDSYNAGPAAAASITFKHGNDLARMTVTCADGVPSASTS